MPTRKAQLLAIILAYLFSWVGWGSPSYASQFSETTPTLALLSKKEKKRSKKRLKKRESMTKGPSGRAGKMFLVAGEVGYMSGFMYGGRAGIQFGDLLFEGGYAKSSNLQNGFGSEITLLEGRIKAFFTDNIYGGFGVGYRTFSDTTQAIGVNGDKDYNLFSSKDIGLDLALGSQWVFSNFAVGADFVGFYYPLSTMSSSGDPSPLLDDLTKQEVADDFKKKSTSGNIHLLRVYAGFMF